MRSDHIGVLLEVYQEQEKESESLERYILSKADWGIWKKCTEEKFKTWNEANIQWDSVDRMADSFMDVYKECLVKAVPKKENKSQHRRKKPPWWNEDIARARSALNAAKKTYKRQRVLERKGM